MTDPHAEIRVFVDSRPVDVAAGSTAVDAVRALDPAIAADVEASRRIITDSRGLPIDAATFLSAGSILRVVANRDRARRGAADDAETG